MKKIVFICGKGDSSLYMYNALKEDFSITAVIQEDRMARATLIKRRIAKLGPFRVINQLLFQLTVQRAQQILCRRRIELLRKRYGLSLEPLPPEKLHEVPSVNSDDCLKLLQKIDPDVIVVNGTRIISKRILTSTRSIFINTHAGITPQYRGVFGAYWALVNNDTLNCGVTIHQVDTGIDTGAIISQEVTPVDKEDCFITYPIHQYGVATGLMKQAIQEFLHGGEVKTRSLPPDVPSKLWHHPPLTFYLYHRIFRGIK